MYLQLIGLFLIIVACTKSYNVLINEKSDAFWLSRFEGKKMSMGCLTPLFLFILGLLTLIYAPKIEETPKPTQETKELKPAITPTTKTDTTKKTEKKGGKPPIKKPEKKI